MDKVAQNVHRAIEVTVANWDQALANARAHQSDGLKAARYDGAGGTSGTPTSSTEAAALTNTTTRDRTQDLKKALTRLDDAAADLTSLVHQLTPPTRRPGACSNEGGCPDGSAAAREGLCHRCWRHQHHYQRPRTFKDEQDRKARHAQRVQQWKKENNK